MQKVKTDLYDALSVPKNADKKTIKNGYRKRSKQTHPDKGGSPEQFYLVKVAHDVLMDDEKRKKYDSTGTWEEAPADNSKSFPVTIIAATLNAVLQECANNGKSPIEMDIIQLIRNKINESISQLEKQIRILKNMLDIDKKISGRFKSNNANGVNFLQNIVQSRIDASTINLANFDKQLKNNTDALNLIKDVKYSFDAPDWQPPYPFSQRINLNF